MRTKILQGAVRLLVLLLVFAVPVWAAEQATLPIVISAGKASCPTCATESSPTNHGIPVWGSGTQEFGVIGPDASSAKVLCSAGLSTDPLFCSLTLGFLPSDTASNWAAKIGTPTGTGEFVRATNPTLAGLTLTGSQSWGGATAPFTFPAGAIASMADFASGIKKGTANVAKMVTTTSGATTTNNCAKWDTDGNLVDSGGTCGGTSVAPPMVMEGQFPFPGGDVNTYMSGAGNISATSGQAQSLAAENMTVGGCSAVWVGNPGTGVVVTLASGTYGGSLVDSSIAITLTTTNTPVSDADTLAITANQGWNWKVDQASGTAADGQLRITCKRTA